MNTYSCNQINSSLFQSLVLILHACTDGPTDVFFVFVRRIFNVMWSCDMFSVLCLEHVHDTCHTTIANRRRMHAEEAISSNF